jgi:hypothetical protein
VIRVAEVDGQVLVARREQVEPPDQVVHVAHGARLRPVPVDGERLPLDRLPEEVRRRAAVVLAHPRPVGVEDARDRGVDALLVVVRHRERFGVTLRLVVDAARADRVHVAPVRLGLRMDLRVAVDLARRADQEPGALPLGEAEGVVGPVRADLERVERQPHVVDGARERREVEHEVDVLVDPDRLRDVVVEEAERARVGGVLDVLERARLQVVDADDPVALLQEVIAEVRPEEAGSAGHDRGGHRAIVLTGPGGIPLPNEILATRRSYPFQTASRSSSARRCRHLHQSVTPDGGSSHQIRRNCTCGRQQSSRR